MTNLKNIAIIAHVDHGKTTFVDGLIHQTLDIRNVQDMGSQIMDSMDQEKERGITITAKNASIYYKDHKVNIVDTPGHADFGGEVERTLRMVDGAVLLVDAQEGPMPQTKFVLKKAIELGHKILVVINKIDKPGSDIPGTLDAIENLFLDLGASDDQLEFPVIYAIGVQGKAGLKPDELQDDLLAFLDVVMETVPNPPNQDSPDSDLQLLTLALKYDEYKGKMAIGRITSGKISKGQSIVVKQENKDINTKVSTLMIFDGLGVKEVESADTGEIVMVAGCDEVGIGDTITTADFNQAMERVEIDQPTIQMTFQVNQSPFNGKEGKFTTSRQIGDRLEKELETNVALRVEPHPDSAERFIVSGRGELHLSVLIETMRREGFEMEIGAPQVIFKDGQEPFEIVEIDVPEEYQGVVMQELGKRMADIQNIEPNETGNEFHFTARMPTRAVMGLRSLLITQTKGTVIMNTLLDGYDDKSTYKVDVQKGSLVSTETGKTMAHALDNAQQRGVLFLGPATEVYVNQIIGQSARSQDLPINPCKGKKLTNVRASGTDDGVVLIPPKILSLEESLEYISDSELVEVTPESIRIRKTAR